MANIFWIFLGILVIVATSVESKNRKRGHRTSGHVRDAPIPDEWDWRTKGAVLPVIDQGQLGNSYGFAVSEAVSAYSFLRTSKLVRASAQEVVDCCLNFSKPFQTSFSNVRSNDVFTCIVNLHGLCWAADYPPETSPATCMASKCLPKAVIKGGYDVKTLNETDMKAAVYANPTVAFINAASLSFQTYVSGVYDDPACDKQNLDHAVLVVGYGQLDGKDVWICKNSWGADWGDQGYIYIARGENICRIADAASIPV